MAEPYPLATSPVFVAAAIAVRLSSPRPVMFKQLRVSRNGHHFTVYKFWTMHFSIVQHMRLVTTVSPILIQEETGTAKTAKIS